MLHGAMGPRITAGPAGLKSLLSPAQVWRGDGSRTPPPSAISVEGDRWAALSPSYKQLPLSPRDSDGVSHTRHGLVLCGLTGKAEREAVQLPWKAVSQCSDGESTGLGLGGKAAHEPLSPRHSFTGRPQEGA